MAFWQRSLHPQPPHQPPGWSYSIPPMNLLKLVRFGRQVRGMRPNSVQPPRFTALARLLIHTVTDHNLQQRPRRELVCVQLLLVAADEPQEGGAGDYVGGLRDGLAHLHPHGQDQARLQRASGLLALHCLNEALPHHVEEEVPHVLRRRNIVGHGHLPSACCPHLRGDRGPVWHHPRKHLRLVAAGPPSADLDHHGTSLGELQLDVARLHLDADRRADSECIGASLWNSRRVH
mmetsp:Transcript_125439/g.366397  ORF Transcript_125439/g.366397 Transcript_125439/m.366397 type:complete len:233 (-) Transcript_125439:806-1504(-)